ncbi:MAG TPA: MFS transporter [Acidiferrobacterales bacterium]|nr:MFS transporter [Acidiferrobacterales bacterium]
MSLARSGPARIVALLCGAEILSMTGFATYPALLPALQQTWGLTNSQAGLISGMFFGGYMLATPVLVSLTDRVDARQVYAFAAALSTFAALGFALFADGLAPALLWQACAGAGLAGTYMPGLKVLSDHVQGPRQSRSVSFYTASFGLGATLSLLIAGMIGAAFGWRWTFALVAAGPAVAGALVIGGLPPHRPSPPPAKAPLLDFRPVFRNRPALGYILGYTVHCWELFGMRSWMVAFLAFSATLDRTASLSLPAATLAAGVNLLGTPASIAGNELANRFGRRRVVLVTMLISASAYLVGFTAGFSGWLAAVMMGVYFIAIMADSAALTAGAIGAAEPGRRGATMAVHSILGFGAGFVSPLVFGAVLDVAGGNSNRFAWGCAFATLGVGCALAPLIAAVDAHYGARRRANA